MSFLIYRLTEKEYVILITFFYSMAGTRTVGGLVVRVRTSRALWRREKEWLALGWLYLTMKLYLIALGTSALAMEL